MSFYLRVLGGVLGFLLASAYGVAIALGRRERSRVARDTARMFSRLMRPPLGLRVEVEGRENLPAEGPCIYVVNHQSVYDVPVLGEIFPAETVVIGKKELRHIPLFGWLFAATGNVLIDRKNNPSAVGRLREAEEAILSRRVSVWIFPEGTRGEGTGKLLPFKKGAFYMAIATGAPLVPVVVSPLRTLFDPARRLARPGTARVRVLEPIPTRGLSDADLRALMATTHARMQQALDGLSATLPSRPSSVAGD